ncbi:MAG: MBL fold metallo-hydrolase [Flavobacteriales bacterium]|nr:MBL fold metallo-hydrolase [Flavobacteriales bacterium]
MVIVLWVLLAVILALTGWMLLYFRFAPRIGGNPAGERLKRIRALRNYHDGQLHNLVPTDMNMPMSTMLKVMWTMLRGADGREPEQLIPVVQFDRAAWEQVPDNEAAICWFGHSCVLIKLDGVTFLTDPVFGERASTFTFAGPKRFAYTEHMRVELLPHLDVVLLSHDHYDHLCYETMKELVIQRAQQGLRFITALGVGAHLEKWGVPSSSITELEWWQQLDVGASPGQGAAVKLTFAPARHFTGRGMTNRFSTLWGSFVLQGRNKRIYFGADSGYSPTFKEIGERFGPFDLALLECGAYSEYWPEIHMFPEETAQAALDVRATVLMPIHWGKFALGLHPWKESIERISRIASERRISLLTPRIGQIITSFDPAQSEQWWAQLK